MKRFAFSVVAGSLLAPLALSQAHTFTRADAVNASTAPDRDSMLGSISADGEHVVFLSDANNLVPTPPGLKVQRNMYIRDLRNGNLVQVNLAPDGSSMPMDSTSAVGFAPGAVSADGSYVAFQSGLLVPALGDNDVRSDIFVRDTVLGTTTLISATDPAGSSSVHYGFPTMSGDGRYIAYLASDPGTPIGDPTFGRLVLHDRALNTTVEVASYPILSWDGIDPSPAISLDGSTIAFAGSKNVFTGGPVRSLIVTYDVASGAVTENIITTSHLNAIQNVSIDATGTKVAFSSRNPLTPDDNDVTEDVFVLDLATQALRLVSKCYLPGSEAIATDPSMSPNGRYVAFESTATCYTGVATEGPQVVVADLDTGMFTLQTINDLAMPGDVSMAKYAKVESTQALSADGERLVFHSSYRNLANPMAPFSIFDTDIATFVRDRNVDGPNLRLEALTAGGTATLFVEGATPSGALLVGVSLAGQTPQPTPFGLVELTPPWTTFPVVANGVGDVVIGVPVPPVLGGQRVWLKALDLPGAELTTTFMGVVQ